jgi:hypothetical protein
MMEDRVSYIVPLLEKVEQYGKTSLELIELKTIYTTTKVATELVSKSAVFIAISMSIVVFSIGVALWLGDMLGASYYGFFCVAAFYAIIGGVLFYFFPNKIKNRVSRFIISKMLN